MANTRISDLTASASNLASTDLAPVVQTVGVGPVKMTGLQLAGGLLGSTTFNGSTVTTSSPVLNLTQTWNAGAVTFTGLKFNATDTASASGSLLLDLQVGGASRFAVAKSGSIAASSVAYFLGIKVSNAASTAGVNGLYADSNGVQIASGTPFGWVSTSNPESGTLDLILRRANTATLQLGAADAAAPVAQTFKVQSGTAGASATTVSISGTSLTIAGTVTGTIAIGHAVTGTGVSAGTLITAGSGTSWTVNNSQTVGPITAYFNSVGADFTIRGSQGSGPSAGGSIIFQVAPAGSAATTAQNAYSTALTIDSTKLLTVDTKALFPNGAYNAPSICISTTSKGFYYNATQGALYTFDGGDRFYVKGANAGVCAGGAITWSNSDASAIDTYLYRDAANTLALRNGTSAQEFRVYGTTDGTNSEFGVVSADTGAVYFGHAKTGTGSVREIRFLNGGTVKWKIDTSGNFLANADNAVDIGASGANRPRNLYVAGTISGGGLISTNSDIRVGSASYVYWNTRTQMSAPADGVLLLQNYAATDFTSVKFGGTTSSFPALKRISSGNCLQVIAADNTASAGFIVGNQALATSATDGFLYVPTCAGTPTGTPTTQTGTAPIVVDTTNNKLYFYSGGAWRDAGP